MEASMTKVYRIATGKHNTDEWYTERGEWSPNEDEGVLFTSLDTAIQTFRRGQGNRYDNPLTNGRWNMAEIVAYQLNKI